MDYYLAEKMGFFRDGTEATNFNHKTVSMSNSKLTEKNLSIKPETKWIHRLDYKTIRGLFIVLRNTQKSLKLSSFEFLVAFASVVLATAVVSYTARNSKGLSF